MRILSPAQVARERRLTWRSWTIYYTGADGGWKRKRFPADQRSNAREYAKTLTETPGMRWVTVEPPASANDTNTYRWTRRTGWVIETPEMTHERKNKA